MEYYTLYGVLFEMRSVLTANIWQQTLSTLCWKQLETDWELIEKFELHDLINIKDTHIISYYTYEIDFFLTTNLITSQLGTLNQSTNHI